MHSEVQQRQLLQLLDTLQTCKRFHSAPGQSEAAQLLPRIPTPQIRDLHLDKVRLFEQRAFAKLCPTLGRSQYAQVFEIRHSGYRVNGIAKQVHSELLEPGHSF